MKSSSTPVEIVHAIYAAFGRGDLPAILAHLHENVEWRVNVDRSAPGAASISLFASRRGPQQVNDFFRELGASIEMHAFQPRSFMANGREVAVHVTMEITVRSTGTRFTTETIHHWTLDSAGQVVRFVDYLDTLGEAAAWNTVRAAS